ncbi:MAG: phytanoyl-CoA dioxygenase, partial [Shimia sp.]|nr:phytanoyl-CoA dioxygenase [Shimia sp.]
MAIITQQDIDTFQTDGVAIIRGLFADHLDALRAGIARNMETPGPYASENKKDGETGRFFDDYCNWQRIPE